MPPISVVGHTATDHIFLVPGLPEKNHSTIILDHQVFFGGGAANIAAGIAKLGGQSELVSCVGDDFNGGAYDRWMDSLGITKRLFHVEGANSSSCFLYNDQAGDQVTYFEWGASRHFQTAEAPNLPFVHMATADPEFNVKIAAQSEFTSFDPGQDLLLYSKEQLTSIIDNADILFANEFEVNGMVKTIGITKKQLAESVPLAIFTRGKNGSEIFFDGNVHTIPVVPVELKDPTGAGDAYRAGFLTAYKQGIGALTAAKIGTVTASFAVESVGCQTNLPTWDETLIRYRQHFGNLPTQ